MRNDILNVKPNCLEKKENIIKLWIAEFVKRVLKFKILASWIQVYGSILNYFSYSHTIRCKSSYF